MSKAIRGIYSVDFYVKATGEGVVNSNGSFSIFNPMAQKTVDNHSMPKLKGVDPLQRATREDGQRFSLSLKDDAFAKAALFVSSECIRAALFKECSYGVARVGGDNVRQALASDLGWLRGYLIAESGKNFARKSPLHVTDFECAKPGLVFNQGTNSRARGTDAEKNSMYSYFKTNSDLEYIGKASLSIEDLQFIALENSMGRSAYDHQISVATGNDIAKEVTQYLCDIAGAGQSPEARFVKRVTRRGSIANQGDAGLILNQDAMMVLINQVVEMFQSLYIRQGKGFLQAFEVVVDFNDSRRVFRAEKDLMIAQGKPESEFAIYYDEHELSDVEFAARQKEVEQREKERKDAKAASKAEKAEKAERKNTKKANGGDQGADTQA